MNDDFRNGKRVDELQRELGSSAAEVADGSNSGVGRSYESTPRVWTEEEVAELRKGLEFHGRPQRKESPEELAQGLAEIEAYWTPLIAAEEARRAKMTPEEIATEAAEKAAEDAELEAEDAELEKLWAERRERAALTKAE